MQKLLTDVQARLRDGSLVLHEGMKWDDLGFEVCCRRIHETQYLAINWFYLAKQWREERTGQRLAVDAFQLFFPDGAGLYPWEEGCARDICKFQPQLFLPAEEEPRTRRMLAAAGRV
jgi:hypothetical protein